LGQKNVPAYSDYIVLNFESFECEYLGQCEFILKTNLGYKSGDQAGACDEKKDFKNLLEVYLEHRGNLTTVSSFSRTF
jgi:hypothetical protein